MPKKELVGYILKKVFYLKGENSSFGTLLQKNYRLDSKGFSLIEYIVVLAIIGVLVSALLYAINPFGQIQRGNDAQRRQDLQQIKNALEAYYEDNECYPTEGSEFTQALYSDTDRQWSGVNDSVYMVEVPQDPTCNQTNGYCYEYITDTESSCPQWNVVFAKLEQPVEQTALSCPLNSEEVVDSCVPEGYDDSWACSMSGSVNCQLLAASSFDYDSGTEVGGEEPTPTPEGPEPPPSIPEGGVIYSLGGGSSFNPYMTEMLINPLWPDPDTLQLFSLSVEDEVADITSVKVHLFSDSGYQELTLERNDGSATDGTWETVIQTDTYNEKFVMALVSEDANGNQRCTVLTPRGTEPEADQMCDDINGTN